MPFVITATTVVTTTTEGFVVSRISSPSLQSTDRQINRNFASWSQHAEFDQYGDIFAVRSERIDEYNLASPREWLEYHEGKCGCGAYTVVRCDLLSNTRSWRVWEKDFHWKRLADSYRDLTDDCGADCEDAINRTEMLMSTLLTSCQSTLMSPATTFHTDSCCTGMLTILWQTDEHRCSVRGHLFTAGVFSNPIPYDPKPISASLAMVTTPNRYENKPRSKLSSWCSIRRPLEDQFKIADDSEVFLTREADHGICEILEGLTSNLFVLYRNATLRTPADGVLEGCARSLVLRHAQSMGYSVDCSPVTLSSAGEWEEVFCTSSIRLIIPVSKVVDGKSGRTVWQASREPRKWRKLYENILADSG